MANVDKNVKPASQKQISKRKADVAAATDAAAMKRTCLLRLR